MANENEHVNWCSDIVLISKCFKSPYMSQDFISFNCNLLHIVVWF